MPFKQLFVNTGSSAGLFILSQLVYLSHLYLPVLTPINSIVFYGESSLYVFARLYITYDSKMYERCK
jgi:hypothetical protein